MSDDEVTRYIPIYQSGCKNSRRILWMKEFLNTETHTRVLLMDHLLSRRENWHRASTVFTLISRKTEISSFARGLKLQGPLAEDALGGCRTSCRKFWWFDHSRSRRSKWRMWISKQLPICSRGAGLGHPVDPVLSVQNKNFSGITKELAKVLGADQETKSHLHWQFLGVWQSLWTSVVESLHVNPSPFRNKWDCWESSTQN